MACPRLFESKNDISMHVITHNWSATKQRPHPQSVAEISRHSVITTHAELITPAVYLYSCLATVIRQSTFRA